MATLINDTSSPATSPVKGISKPVNSTRQVAANQVAEVYTGSVQAGGQAGKRELEAAVSNINDFVQNIQRNIHFSVSETSGRTIIEVYDKETDELIREIPSEEVQRISAAIAEQLSEGLLVKTNI